MDTIPVMIPHWNATAGEWQTLTVAAPAEPRKRARRRRTRRPAGQRAPLVHDDAPLPAWWRDTAYAPGEPLADMRTYLKAPAIRTHRAAIVMPADPERVTVTA